MLLRHEGADLSILLLGPPYANGVDSYYPLPGAT